MGKTRYDHRTPHWKSGSVDSITKKPEPGFLLDERNIGHGPDLLKKPN